MITISLSLLSMIIELVIVTLRDHCWRSLIDSSCRQRGGFLVGGDVFVHDEVHDATIVGV